MEFFTSKIEKIGINPFVYVPNHILNKLFKQNGKDKGPIPIKGLVNGDSYQQTLVKYRGVWRLYINAGMLKNSPERIGETIEVGLAFDPSDRSVKPHPRLVEAMNRNPSAKEKFEALTPSLQKEIIRYISFLKTEKSIDRNVSKAINFLLGKESFIGRKPLS